MSATGQDISPAVTEWLGKPMLLVEAARCDICGTPSTDLETQSGWSYALGDTLDVSVCAACRGEGDD